MQSEDSWNDDALTRRRIIKWGGGIAGVGAMSALIAACGGDDASSTAGSEPGGGGAITGNGEEYLFGLYLSSLSMWNGARKGMEDIGKILNVKFKEAGTPTPDAPAEVQAIQQGITGKTKGLIVAAAEDEVLAPLINQQLDKGIPAVTIDGPAFSSNALSHLGTSSREAGRQCGEELIKRMGGQGNVILTRATTVSVFAVREQGFRDAVAATDGKVKIAAVVNDYDQADKAAQSVGQSLQAHPDVQGVMTLSAGAGVGTVTALDQAGKGDVQVGVFSNEKVAYEQTKTKKNLFVIAQDHYKMGFFAGLFVHIAAKGLSRPNYDFDKHKISTLPPIVDTGINVVDSTNADGFIAGVA